MYSSLTWNRWHDTPRNMSCMASLTLYYFQSPLTGFISLDCSKMRISDKQGDCCISFPFSQVQQLWYLGSKVYGFRRVYPLAQPLGLVYHPGPQSGAVFISWLERSLGRLLPLLLFSISDVGNRFGFLLCVFVEPEKMGGQIWRMWVEWECGLNLGARVELFCPPHSGKPRFGSCAQPYLVSLFQQL